MASANCGSRAWHKRSMCDCKKPLATGLPPFFGPGVMRVGFGERVMPSVFACAAGAQPERKQHARRRTGPGSGNQDCCAAAPDCVPRRAVGRTSGPPPDSRTLRSAIAWLVSSDCESRIRDSPSAAKAWPRLSRFRKPAIAYGGRWLSRALGAACHQVIAELSCPAT